MARYDTVTIRVNDHERKEIRELAERLQRTESDAIRFVVREKVRELAPSQAQAAPAPAQPAQVRQPAQPAPTKPESTDGHGK